MTEFPIKSEYDMSDLRKILTILRGKDGCPWDKEQNHKSMRKNFLEETYEVLEAIDNEDTVLLKEELGDVLLQVVFHAQIEEEKNSFSLDEVVTNLCVKLITRHPHVFKNVSADNAEEALKNWESMKKEEKSQTSLVESLEAVPKMEPALMRAQKVGERAARSGIDYPDEYAALSDLEDVIGGIFTAMQDGNINKIDNHIGEILFSCVNIARHYKIDCEKSLTNSTEKFINRFRNLEELANKQGVCMEKANSEKLMALWQKAKSE